MIRRLQDLSDKQVFGVLVAIAVLSLGFSIVSHMMSGSSDWWAWSDGAFQNFSTEMMGAIATFALIEIVVGNRNEREKLLARLHSKDNTTVIRAVEELRINGWISDGTLSDINLSRCNLSSVNLEKAKLNGVDFSGSNLTNANLRDADLRGADLGLANLQGATLSGADLVGANLQEVNLADVKWQDIMFLNHGDLTLPDGTVLSTQSYNDIDLGRFLSHSHPEYAVTLEKINQIRHLMGFEKIDPIPF